MKLVVGLGNPGVQYARTRHNVGFLVLDALAERQGLSWKKEGDSETAELRLNGPLGTEKVLLQKPQTFMNTSGRAVGPLLSYYRLTPADLLVVQDDLDSPFGLLKLRMGGRHGGQNGVRDIIRVLGGGVAGEGFARLKIGISRPPAGRDPADWVLSRWAPEEASTLAELLNLGVQATELWAKEGLAAAQGRFNSTDLRPTSPEPEAPELEPAPQADL